MRRSMPLAPLPALAFALPARAQNFPQPSGFTVENPVMRRIWAIGMDSSMIEHFGQVLFDSLGPRLVASPQMEAAQDWMGRQYPAMGIEARKQRDGTGRGWRRGPT